MVGVCCRQRKDELEQRMSSLQESRRELMVQLEGLMKLLKVTNTQAAYCFQHGALSHSGGQSFLFSSHLPVSVLAVTSLTFPSAISSLIRSPFVALTLSDIFFSILFLTTCFRPCCPCCGPVGWGTATGSKFIPLMLDFWWCKCEIQPLCHPET